MLEGRGRESEIGDREARDRIEYPAPIRSRDNSGGSRVIKQPHTLENYRNGRESCNKETREDKARTQVTIRASETLHATDDDGADSIASAVSARLGPAPLDSAIAPWP